jgi:hypothetical protein
MRPPIFPNNALGVAMACAVMEPQEVIKKVARDDNFHILQKKLNGMSHAFLWQKLLRNIKKNAIDWSSIPVEDCLSAINEYFKCVKKAFFILLHFDLLLSLFLSPHKHCKFCEIILLKYPPPLEIHPQIQTTCAPNG